MQPLITTLGVWIWFIAGGLLLIAEIVMPGVFMLWLGLAALLVGAISLFVGWAWQAQLVAFAVFALAAIPLWRRLALRVEEPSDQPFLNRRSDAFVGRVFTLSKPIVDGGGTIAIDDTVWRVSGADAPAGSRVRVTRADGATLYVERAEG
jgi:membrane protein implicated in regulation of membrane protease activity